MRIMTMTWESGNDFRAVLECEHCRATQPCVNGYHDNFYHTKVIPAITCRACGKNRAGEEPHKKNDGTLSVVASPSR